MRILPVIAVTSTVGSYESLQFTYQSFLLKLKPSNWPSVAEHPWGETAGAGALRREFF